MDLDRHLVHIDNTALTIRRAFDQLVVATQEEKEKYRHLCSITEKDLRVALGGKVAHHRSRAEKVLAEIARESDAAVKSYEKEIHDVVVNSWLRGNQDLLVKQAEKRLELCLLEARRVYHAYLSSQHCDPQTAMNNKVTPLFAETKQALGSLLSAGTADCIARLQGLDAAQVHDTSHPLINSHHHTPPLPHTQLPSIFALYPSIPLSLRRRRLRA